MGLLSFGIDNFFEFYVNFALPTTIFDIDNFDVVFALACVGKFFPVRRIRETNVWASYG